MLLILADHHDVVAGGMVARVSAAGGEWQWLSPLDLATARWTHTLTDKWAGGGSGRATTSVRTADGFTVELSRITGVLNRLTWLPPAPPFQRAEDREYALMERHALLTSVLAGIAAPVVNSVRPPSLSGPLFNTVAWLALAARARVPVRRMRVTTDGRRWQERGWQPLDWQAVTTLGGQGTLPLHTAVPAGRRPVAWAEPVGAGHRVTVVNDRAIDSPDGGWGRRCTKLAALSGCQLLEVTLAQRDSDRSWVVTGANPSPTALPETAFESLIELLVAGRATAGRVS